MSSIRFELMTYRLGGGRSILLSYEDEILAEEAQSRVKLRFPVLPGSHSASVWTKSIGTSDLESRTVAYPRWESNPHLSI